MIPSHLSNMKTTCQPIGDRNPGIIDVLGGTLLNIMIPLHISTSSSFRLVGRAKAGQVSVCDPAAGPMRRAQCGVFVAPVAVDACPMFFFFPLRSVLPYRRWICKKMAFLLSCFIRLIGGAWSGYYILGAVFQGHHDTRLIRPSAPVADFVFLGTRAHCPYGKVWLGF